MALLTVPLLVAWPHIASIIAVVLVALLSVGVWLRHVATCTCMGVDTVMVLHRFPKRFGLFGLILFCRLEVF